MQRREFAGILEMIDYHVGYRPGVIGHITELHGIYYYENWGFDVSFESQVARDLSEFILDFDENRDGIWTAYADRELAGSIVIDGSNAQQEGARLRWFIVAPGYQKQGIGRDLMVRAMAFCDANNYPTVFLWTFNGLDPARRLYENNGFILCEEKQVAQWGQHISEQRFERNLLK
jgi:GNAT superfamily N-acetyltransferase